MKKLVLAVYAVTVSFVAFSQDSTIVKLEEVMKAFHNAGRFNGSVLVARQGNILLQSGYGTRNAEDHSINDAHSIYQIASVTKTFTSTLVLRMVELKKMSLNDRLSKYYSGFPNGDSITIRHLLNHTSGIRSYTQTDTSIAETDESRIIPYIKSLTPDFLPGAAFNYSNSGYVILGYIIEKVSGMSYWQALRKYIFEPLQMRSSGFDFDHLSANEKAIGYDVLSLDKSQPAYVTDSTAPFAAGAIYSTVIDLYKWHRGLQDLKIVKKVLLDEAYKPSTKNSYGFGWQIDSIAGKKRVSHSGSISGFGSNFARIIADDICIVLLSNKSGATFETVNITDRLLAVLYGRPYTIPVKRTPVRVSLDTLKTYEGAFENEEFHLVVHVKVEDGRLVARPERGPLSPMLPVNATTFYSETDEELEIIFNKNEQGQVIQFTLNHRDRTGVFKKTK